METAIVTSRRYPRSMPFSSAAQEEVDKNVRTSRKLVSNVVFWKLSTWIIALFIALY